MTAVAAAVTRMGTHQRLGAIVVGVAALPSLAIGVSFGSLAVWIVAMLAVAAAVVWLLAGGFDRRYPITGIGSALLRVLAVVGAIALAMLLFADPWTFGQPTSARVAFGGIMAAALALSIWFGRTGQARAPEQREPNRFADKLHLIVAILAAAVVVPLSFLLAALVAYCGAGESFYWIFGGGLVIAGLPIAAGVALDRRGAGRDGVAAAVGRIGLILIATTVLVVFLLSLASLPAAECN